MILENLSYSLNKAKEFSIKIILKERKECAEFVCEGRTIAHCKIAVSPLSFLTERERLYFFSLFFFFHGCMREIFLYAVVEIPNDSSFPLYLCRSCEDIWPREEKEVISCFVVFIILVSFSFSLSHTRTHTYLRTHAFVISKRRLKGHRIIRDNCFTTINFFVSSLFVPFSGLFQDQD